MPVRVATLKKCNIINKVTRPDKSCAAGHQFTKYHTTAGQAGRGMDGWPWLARAWYEGRPHGCPHVRPDLMPCQAGRVLDEVPTTANLSRSASRWLAMVCHANHSRPCPGLKKYHQNWHIKGDYRFGNRLILGM